MTFDLFVGVDWSGAKGPRLPGLQVAACDASGNVSLITGPWTRQRVAEWLLDQVRAGHRVLCGADFSFCFPWADQQAYFPCNDDDPAGPGSFADVLEAACAGDADLYGGRFAETAPFDAHFHRRGVHGARFNRRLRVAEVATMDQGLGAPESVFNLVGARQVGKSSLAGIRFLRWLKQNPGVAIWPFDDISDAQLVLVETFPTAFVRMAGAGLGKVRDRETLDFVLSHFGEHAVPPALRDGRGAPSSARTAKGTPFALRSARQRASRRGNGEGLTDDETDALITAAALRHLSPQAELWRPPGMSDMVRRKEGWTFGIL